MGILSSACTIGCGGVRIEGDQLAISSVLLVDAICERVPAIRFYVEYFSIFSTLGMSSKDFMCHDGSVRCIQIIMSEQHVMNRGV